MNVTELVTITAHECGQCGITFGMPQRFLEERRKDRKTFYCPNGHPRVFRVTTEQLLRRQLENTRERERATRELLEHETASHRTTRGHLTRKRKQLERVSHGVCPCCSRSFQNLARHMQTKHPDWNPG